MVRRTTGTRGYSGYRGRRHGRKVLAVLLPDRAYNWLMRYERFGMLVLLVVISVGVGSNALNSAIRWTFTLLCRLVGFEV